MGKIANGVQLDAAHAEFGERAVDQVHRLRIPGMHADVANQCGPGTADLFCQVLQRTWIHRWQLGVGHDNGPIDAGVRP